MLGFCAYADVSTDAVTALSGNFGTYSRSTAILTQPNMSYGNDTLYVVYKQYKEDVLFTIDAVTHMSHLYLVKSGDNGATWSAPLDITPTTDGLREHAFPDMLPTVDNAIRIMYQRDAFPSTYVYGSLGATAGPRETFQNSASDNSIIYLEIGLGGEGIGIEKVLNPMSETGVYPNPSNGEVNLMVILFKDIAANITVRNSNGQVVHTYSGSLSKGRNDVHMDLNHLGPGLYIIDITGGGSKLTEKLMIK